jgi:hypothetical protein
MSGIDIPEGRTGTVVVTDVEYEDCEPSDTNWEVGLRLTPQVGGWALPEREHPNGVGVQKRNPDGSTAGLTRVRTEDGRSSLAIGGAVYITAEPV